MTQWLNAGFAFVLLAGVPALSYRTARDLKLFSIPRLTLYACAVISQWALAVLGLWVVSVTSADWAQLGFRWGAVVQLIGWTLGLTAVALIFMAAMLPVERTIGWPAEGGDLTRRLLPETFKERLCAALLVAPTAGFCEEFLYRGYLLTYVSRRFPSGPWAVIISSVAFGAAHCYQGLAGIAGTSVLGVMLAYPVRRLGTLYPSMVAHTLADAVGMVWIIPFLLARIEKRKPEKQACTASCDHPDASEEVENDPR